MASLNYNDLNQLYPRDITYKDICQDSRIYVFVSGLINTYTIGNTVRDSM